MIFCDHRHLGRPIIYFSCASGSQFKTCRELKYPHVLINFATKKNKPPAYGPDLFIDCGGFFSSLKSGRYTSSDQEYLEYVQKWRPKAWALRDYPCEPQLLKQCGRTATENIHRTLEHHLHTIDLAEDYDLEMTAVPVLQGWTVEDYLYCLDLYRSAGLVMGYMAIGSICRRSQIGQITKIILSLRRELPGWVRLHGFGLKYTALKEKAIWDALYSVDSGAWDYEARWRKHRGELSVPEASYIVASQYLQKLEYLEAWHRGQSTLPGAEA